MFIRDLLVLLGCCLLSFSFIRSFFYGLKRYQLNNSAYKKRKKGESFKEWLLYSRYREEIPKALLVFYFLILLIHGVGILICICAHVIGGPQEVSKTVVKLIFYFDAAWIIIIGLLFWSPGFSFAYRRWISKRKGQSHKK